jgi:hypothetical protein
MRGRAPCLSILGPTEAQLAFGTGKIARLGVVGFVPGSGAWSSAMPMTYRALDLLKWVG